MTSSTKRAHTVRSRLVLSLVRVQMCSPTSGDGSRPQRHQAEALAARSPDWQQASPPLSTSSPWLAPDYTTRSPSTDLQPFKQRLAIVTHDWASHRLGAGRRRTKCGARPELAVTVTPLVGGHESPRLTNAQPETRRTDRLASKRRQHVAKRNELPSMDVHRRTPASGHPYTK